MLFRFYFMTNNYLASHLQKSIDAKRVVINDQALIAIFSNAADTVVSAYKAGGKLFIAGNGGSAADAQHLAAELVCRLAKDRPPLSAEALTVDSSTLTAIANDYGFDHVFSRQLVGKATSKDIFLAISTSGNSENIYKALQTCKDKNITSILFTGASGGRCAPMANYAICIPEIDTAIIQEIHICLVHALCSVIESKLFP
jgi:D-sedoheptulose 7-phosphate isomerase